MKKLVSILALTFAFGSAFAATSAAPAGDASGAKPMSKQQGRMADCNATAKEKALKGSERKQFMSSCLSDKKKGQQDKMTTCNKDAKDKALKGDERKEFMSSCLSA
jgi:hypothetical protein